MIRYAIPLLLLFAAVNFAPSVQADVWRVHQPGGDGRIIDRVWFADPNVGWAVGLHGLIYRTEDGGKVWSEQVSGTTQRLWGVWGSNAANVWAVGDGGTILKWDGATWGPQTSGTISSLRGVWGTSATDVWVVGAGGVIRRWNGNTWAAQSSGTATTLLDVSGIDGSNIWAVGSSGVVVRWNGTTWSPQSSNVTQSLFGVSALNTNNVWAVGAGGTIIYWNGSTWSAQTSDTTQTLIGTWAGDATNVWAVGENGTILRWNGSVWAAESSGTAYGLWGVCGTGTGSVWAAGTGGTILKRTEGSWITQKYGYSDLIYGLWGSDPLNLWAVGGTGIILKWDGFGWSPQPSGTTLTFYGLWGTDASNIWAVGTTGVIRRWNGSVWSSVSSGTASWLRAVWGTDAANVWAVGDSGVIRRWNGASWTAQISGSSSNLGGVWGANASNVWAVGQAGTILRWDGSQWVPQAAPTTQWLRGVWGTDADNLWAVGDAGTILKYDGITWVEQTSGTAENLQAVWGTDQNHIWVAGTNGTILKWNGSNWATEKSNVGTLRSAVWGFAENRVVIAGWTGLIQTNAPPPAPEIVVTGEGVEVVNGASIPELAIGTDFGGAKVAGETVTRWFTISNTGDAPLVISGVPKVALSGPHAADFSVMAEPASAISPYGGTSAFSITFDPSSIGMRTAHVAIANDDADESSYTFAIQGTGLNSAPTSIALSALSIDENEAAGTDVAEITGTDPDPGESATLSFALVPGVGDDDNASFSVASTTLKAAASFDHERKSTYTIRLRATDTGTPNLSFEAVFTVTITDVNEEPTLTGVSDQTVKVNTVDHGITIQVEDPETAAELLAVTAESNNAVVVPQSGIEISGTGRNRTVSITPAANMTGSAVITITVSDGALARSDAFLLTVTAPEITVEGPEDAVIENGGSFSFGSVLTSSGTTIAKTFAIRNSGNDSLVVSPGSAVQIAGAHEAEFAVTTQPANVVESGGFTTFVVTFKPAAIGLRTAILTITNDDLDENPYTFVIEGMGLSPGVVGMSQPVFEAHQGAASVPITVIRTNGNVPASVALLVSDGLSSKVPPFEPAVAGKDYVAQGTPLMVDFGADESTKTIQISLLSRSGVVPNKRFAVTLSPVADGAGLGTPIAAEVRILANDTTKPTLTVRTPTPNVVSALSPYLVTGIAGDAKGIAKVEVSLNGAIPILAVLGPATTPASVPYAVPIVPLPDNNTLVVIAYDLRGNSTTITRNFNFTRRYAFSISHTAPHGITLGSTGSVALAATPAASASFLTPTTANANPKVATVVPATTVKLTAAATPGLVFKRWIGLPGAAVVLGDVATFAMPSADVAVAAEFVASPFVGIVGASTTFVGLVHPTADTPSVNSTEGLVTGTLTAAGAFTGKLLIDGLTQPINAKFYGDGSAVFTVGATKKPMLTFGGRTLMLSFHFEIQAIKAVVTTDFAISQGFATRPLYSPTNKVPVDLHLLNSAPASTKGFYTVSLPSKVQEESTASAYPQGHGISTLNLTNSGGVTFTGTLADGTTITGSSSLLAGHVAPFLIQMPTPGAPAVKGSSFSGTLAFNSALEGSDVTGTDLRWFRAAAVGTAAATHLYTSGWPEGIRIDAIGALYNTAAKVQATLGLPTADAAALVFTDGKLTGEIFKDNFSITGNIVSESDPNYTLTVVPGIGAFRGTFRPNWLNQSTTMPAYKGILLQKGANKGGFGFFISNIKNDADPESGSVTLGAN